MTNSLIFSKVLIGLNFINSCLPELFVRMFMKHLVKLSGHYNDKKRVGCIKLLLNCGTDYNAARAIT